MKLVYCGDGYSRAYYAKGFLDTQEFMDALRKEVDADDPILKSQPEHCWMRMVRDFEEGQTIIDEAAPHSRGAFQVTWIEQG